MDIAASVLHLADLNYYCLRAIFDQLTHEDLVAVGQCCHSFNDIANEIMRGKVRESRVTVLAECQLPVLTKYGKEIKNLAVEFPEEVQHLEDVNRLCPNLKILRLVCLSNVIFTEEFPAKLFSRLTELEMDMDVYDQSRTDDDDIQIGKIMQRCKHVTRLALSGSIIRPFLTIRYPALVALKVDNATDITPNIFWDFCKRNKQVESLDFTKVNRIDYLRAPILKDLKNLKEFRLQISHNYLSRFLCRLTDHFHEIPTLRSLTIEADFEHGQSMPSFEHLTQLESIRLKFKWPIFREGYQPKYADLNHLVSYVENLPQLTIFKIPSIRLKVKIVNDEMDMNDLENRFKLEAALNEEKMAFTYWIKYEHNAEIVCYEFSKLVDMAHLVRQNFLESSRDINADKIIPNNK